MFNYLPEGLLLGTAENDSCLRSADALSECIRSQKILEARCCVCDSRHDLIVDLPCMRGVIPREEGALGITEGTTKDIALISRVNKPVCFVVKEISRDEYGEYALLSRREAQEMCERDFISKLLPGDIINAKVTHLEQFGCFVDIGCGIPSLIPIDLISVSRISHPSDRFYVGQNIRAVIKSFENGRVCLSHKELLGTWEQNAQKFSQGETVTGIIRSVESYGVFVELAPNLAGLAEPRDNVFINQSASVYIKAIIPEKMKIKLVIVDTFEPFDDVPQPDELKYFIDEGHIDRWHYSSESAAKQIETIF
ncbi:MAG: S1 RNA-binding domain-containing protein [Oscillospiraceae bacterium]|nr:S1 RNA-binding domain-containing protein [Oscillospiraceae bacterium]